MPKNIQDILLQMEQNETFNEEIDFLKLCEDDAQLADEVRRQWEDRLLLKHLLQAPTVSFDHFSQRETRSDPNPPTTPPVDFSAKLDRYEIRGLLGQGGFGQVWRAFDPQLQREVAIKIPRPDRNLDETARESFLKDARKAAALDHERIVKVYDIQQRGSTCFIVSALVEEGSLSQWLKHHRISPEEAVRIVIDIADALTHAHQQGIVHRDVKPGNILIQNGRAYLTDFGLAVTEAEQLDEQSGALGTVAYMSPEQARGDCHLLDPRSDIYSLGVVLYHLLTSKLPHVARSTGEYLYQIQSREPWPIRSVNAQVPAPLEAICLRALSKDPNHRQFSASELASQLRAWLRRSKVSRGKLILMSAILVLIGGLTATVYLLARDRQTAQSTDRVATTKPGREHPITTLHWDPLLRKEPMPLCSFLRRSLTLISDKNKMDVEASKAILLRVGSTKGTYYRVRANLRIDEFSEDRQKPGTVAILFGLRRLDRGNGKTRLERQSIGLSFAYGKVCLVRGHSWTNLQDGKVTSTGNLPFGVGIHPLKELKKGKHSLFFDVANGQLIDVRWDREPISTLANQVTNMGLKPGDYLGEVGLLFTHCKVQISDLEIQNYSIKEE